MLRAKYSTLSEIHNTGMMETVRAYLNHHVPDRTVSTVTPFRYIKYPLKEASSTALPAEEEPLMREENNSPQFSESEYSESIVDDFASRQVPQHKLTETEVWKSHSSTISLSEVPPLSPDTSTSISTSSDIEPLHQSRESERSEDSGVGEYDATSSEFEEEEDDVFTSDAADTALPDSSTETFSPSVRKRTVSEESGIDDREQPPSLTDEDLLSDDEDDL